MTSTEIANLSLTHLGIGKEIANLDTERSAEAITMRRIFEMCRDATLRDFPWPFATEIRTLALVEEDPTDMWKYSYRYPTDCLMFRKIESDVAIDTADTRIVYKIGRDASGRLIYTNREDAVAEYTIKITDHQQFTPDFVWAFSLRLASYAAPKITGGDPFKMGGKAFAMYQFEIGKAESAARNEEQVAEIADSEFIRIRN